MGDKYEEAFEQVVLQVCELIFGASQAANPVYQNLCRSALIAVGVYETIESLRE